MTQKLPASARLVYPGRSHAAGIEESAEGAGGLQRFGLKAAFAAMIVARPDNHAEHLPTRRATSD
jgi:hypothetical protein